MAGRRPERAAGNGVWLDHQAWTKIVMGACLGIIVYYQMQSKSNKEVPIAPRRKILRTWGLQHRVEQLEDYLLSNNHCGSFSGKNVFTGI